MPKRLLPDDKTLVDLYVKEGKSCIAICRMYGLSDNSAAGVGARLRSLGVKIKPISVRFRRGINIMSEKEPEKNDTTDTTNEKEELMNELNHYKKLKTKYKLALFMVIRNSAILPMAAHQGKKGKEINMLTFEEMKKTLKMIDFNKAKAMLKEGQDEYLQNKNNNK